MDTKILAKASKKLYNVIMIKKTLLLFTIITHSAFAAELSPEQRAFSDKIVQVLQSGNAGDYKNLIHSQCPVDEAKVTDVVKDVWTQRYIVRLKEVKESYDPKFKFKVTPEFVLEIQGWRKVTDPKLLKMLKNVTEIEIVKNFPVAKDKTTLKILEWPCFDSN